MRHANLPCATAKTHNPESGITLQTLVITAVLALAAVAAGVLFLALGRNTNRNFEGQVPSANNEKCNAVEVYNPSLARLGVKGTNGHIMFGSITVPISNPNDNQKWSAMVTEAAISQFRTDNNIPSSQIDLKTVRYNNEDVGEYWNFPEMRVHADVIGRFQGSAPGCIPVCFWQSSATGIINDLRADPGEFYFSYNTHPEPGIGPSPQHRGVLLATATQVHADLTHSNAQSRIPDSGTLSLRYAASRLKQELDFPDNAKIKGVRVGTDNQSCEAYDADGKTIPARQAKPMPYLPKDNANIMTAQSLQDGHYGEVCADPALAGDHLIDAQNLPCYIFPYTHLR